MKKNMKGRTDGRTEEGRPGCANAKEMNFEKEKTDPPRGELSLCEKDRPRNPLYSSSSLRHPRSNSWSFSFFLFFSLSLPIRPMVGVGIHPCVPLIRNRREEEPRGSDGSSEFRFQFGFRKVPSRSDNFPTTLVSRENPMEIPPIVTLLPNMENTYNRAIPPPQCPLSLLAYLPSTLRNSKTRRKKTKHSIKGLESRSSETPVRDPSLHAEMYGRGAFGTKRMSVVRRYRSFMYTFTKRSYTDFDLHRFMHRIAHCARRDT